MDFMELDTAAQTILFYIACISSGLFIVKIGIMLTFGHMDVHSYGTPDAGDSDGDFHVFSVNTIACFFMGFGWSGLASLREWGFELLPSLAIGVAGGILSSGLLITLLTLAQKLTNVPETPSLKKGDIGEVYSTIPAFGIGKIRVNNKIVQATSDEDIASFAQIKVLEDIVINTNAVAKVTIR